MTDNPKPLEAYLAEAEALKADHAEHGDAVAEAFAKAEVDVAFGDGDDAFEEIFGSPVSDDDLA